MLGMTTIQYLINTIQFLVIYFINRFTSHSEAVKMFKNIVKNI